MQEVLDFFWFYVGEMVIDDDIDCVVVDVGFVLLLFDLKLDWVEMVYIVLGEVILIVFEGNFVYKGSVIGWYSEYLGYLLVEM